MTRHRTSTGEFCMTREVFAAADYGRICQMLGLRPSRPRKRRGQ